MSPEGLDRAHAALVGALGSLRNADGGWPYYAGRRSRLEPTSWAMLALNEPLDATPIGGWLQGDGLLVEPATRQVNYAFNALAALAASGTASAPNALTVRVLEGLVRVRGEAIAPSPAIRQDTSLQAWAWTPGTVSWVEPTSWCALAVKRWRRDAAAKARLDVAEALLRDRVCNGGGWNFGNGEVYGKGLPAHVPPTAVGVLALQDRPADPIVGEAVSFLERQAPVEGSTTALSMTVLALSVLGRPTETLLPRLAEQIPIAVLLGNAVPLAMAACAIEAARHGAPTALSVQVGATP